MKTAHMVFLLVSLSAAQAGGGADCDGWRAAVRDLDADEIERREAAGRELAGRLARLDGAKDRKGLASELRALAGAASVDAPEVRARIGTILAPYAAGGEIWRKAGADLPGPVTHVLELDGNLLAAGPLYAPGRVEGPFPANGWLSLYDRRTGESLWKREDLPAADAVTLLPRGDVLVGGLHDERRTNASCAWYGVYAVHTGNPVAACGALIGKGGMAPGSPFHLGHVGGAPFMVTETVDASRPWLRVGGSG